jgi:hypothetical protein
VQPDCQPAAPDEFIRKEAEMGFFKPKLDDQDSSGKLY